MIILLEYGSRCLSLWAENISFIPRGDRKIFETISRKPPSGSLLFHSTTFGVEISSIMRSVKTELRIYKCSCRSRSKIEKNTLLMDHTGITVFHASKGLTWNIRVREFWMYIIDGTTIFTETYRNRIIWSGALTLTRENNTLSGNTHFMDKSLVTKCIHDTVERCEIHPRMSFATNEFVFEIWECNTICLPKCFYKSFSRFCNTRFCHVYVAKK